MENVSKAIIGLALLNNTSSIAAGPDTSTTLNPLLSASQIVVDWSDWDCADPEELKREKIILQKQALQAIASNPPAISTPTATPLVSQPLPLPSSLVQITASKKQRFISLLLRCVK